MRLDCLHRRIYFNHEIFGNDSHHLDQRILYTQVWIALRRAGLPEELVALITRMADFRLPDVHRTLACYRILIVNSYGFKYRSRIWFRTPPLTRRDLSQLAALQLATFACDQGWTSHGYQGSMSWFELGVFPDGTSDDDMGKKENGSQWRRSHYNQMACRDPAFIQGPIAVPSRDGSVHLKINDCIVVRACTRNPGWQNKALKGELRFWKWFEPVQKVIASHLAQ
jgi:hypothetical protein